MSIEFKETGVGQAVENSFRTLAKMRRQEEERRLLEGRLASISAQAKELAERASEAKALKFTGLVVLLVKDGSDAQGRDRFKCLGVFDPDRDENVPEVFDVVLPIPHPDCMREFDGF